MNDFLIKYIKLGEVTPQLWFCFLENGKKRAT